MDQPTLDRMIRRAEVTRLTGLSRPTIYRLMESGDFPKPVKIGPRAVAWPESSISAWMEGRKAAAVANRAGR